MEARPASRNFARSYATRPPTPPPRRQGFRNQLKYLWRKPREGAGHSRSGCAVFFFWGEIHGARRKKRSPRMGVAFSGGSLSCPWLRRECQEPIAPRHCSAASLRDPSGQGGREWLLRFALYNSNPANIKKPAWLSNPPPACATWFRPSSWPAGYEF